jgi:hypothetical protein
VLKIFVYENSVTFNKKSKIVESIERVLSLRSDAYHGTRVHNKFLTIPRESKIAPFDTIIFE